MTNPESKYIFVVATQYNQTDFWEKSKIAIFLEKAGCSHIAKIEYENKNGLPEVYNSYLTVKNKGKFIIFVHDDVLIDDLFWMEKLDLAFEKYDIVGLAGSRKIDLSKPPAWHLMSNREDHVGEVTHSHEKQVWTTCFGPTNSRVLVMDGLFIAVNVDKLLSSNIRFDERFEFHHYDITFCLRANKNKLKMGVTNLRVVHFGLGDSMRTKEWENSANLFKEYYS